MTPVSIFGGCRLILERGAFEIEVLGPHLQEEAAIPHQGIWVD